MTTASFMKELSQIVLSKGFFAKDFYLKILQFHTPYLFFATSSNS